MRSYLKTAVVFCAVIVFMLCGCGRKTPAGKTPLLCYVGGTMRPALEELARQYEAKTGQKVNIDYAGSGELIVKIETTRKGDLFVGHDPFNAELMKKGLGDQGWVMASLTPMIAVAKGNPKGIHGFKDLARPGLRVAFTHAEYSTAGHIVTHVLKQSKLKTEIEKNVKTITKQGGAAANGVVVGTLDAAVVWNAVIYLRRDKLDAVPIEQAWMPQPDVDAVTTATFGRIQMSDIRVMIATLKCSRQLAQARAFAEFCASPEGQRVFARNGFTPADTTLNRPDAKVPALAGSIMAHCGAGMRQPVQELGVEFTGKTGVKVEGNYAGSNVLLGQIELTRKGDVYMPGDADYIEMARKKWLVTYDRPVCWFVPVIMVQKGNPKGINSLADLTKPGLRVGLGDAKACAVGRLMAPLFKKNGIDAAAVDKNVVLRTPTVNELGLKIKLGTVDAVIVWSSIAAQYPRDSAVVKIPVDKNIIPLVAAATLTTADNPTAARAFVDFMSSPRGKQILKAHQYVVEMPE